MSMAEMAEGKRRGTPDEVDIPDFTWTRHGAADPRPSSYVATRTVIRRKRAYVKAVVQLQRQPHAGRNAVFLLSGQARHAHVYTSAYRRNPPLGPAQKLAGAKALNALATQVRDALLAAGWRKVGPGGRVLGDEWWQAPEGADMDEEARRREVRAPLQAAVADALAALLDGEGAEEARSADYQGRTWGVSAHRTAGGQVLVVLDPDPWLAERVQAAREWAEEHGEGLPVVEVPADEATWHGGRR